VTGHYHARPSVAARLCLVVAAAMLLGVAACGTGTPLADGGDVPGPDGASASPAGATPAASAGSPGVTTSPTRAPRVVERLGRAPSPSPSRSSAPPPPRTTGGKPGPANTGVPAGVALSVVTGDRVFGTDNQVVSGKDFRGFVRVTGRNITFKNCIFRGRATSSNAALIDTEDGTNTVIQDSEVVPRSPSATIDGVWANRTKIYRADIHGSVDGVKTGSDVLVQDSYIHDLSWFASDPNQGGGETHNDGVQSFLGDARVTLRHNTIDMSTTKNANAAWQNSAKDSRVEGNWLDGGGCTLNFNHVNTPLNGLYVVGNRFGRHSFFKCPILLSTQSFLAQNSGNVWDDTGQPIPPPQRHD
jgi:hypothetical protein